jgi:hypothetical protein
MWLMRHIITVLRALFLLKLTCHVAKHRSSACIAQRLGIRVDHTGVAWLTLRAH